MPGEFSVSIENSPCSLSSHPPQSYSLTHPDLYTIIHRDHSHGTNYRHDKFPAKYLIEGEDGLFVHNGLIVTKDTPNAELGAERDIAYDMPEPLELFNGDFEFGSYAGWWYHGGNWMTDPTETLGKVERDGSNYFLNLNADQLRTHNYSYAPSSAHGVAFDLTVVIPSSDAFLEITANGDVVAELGIASAGTTTRQLRISEFEGMVTRIGFRLQSGGNGNQQVHLDNIRWAELLNTVPTLGNVSTLTEGQEDTEYGITYQSLSKAADEADADADSISFRIESVNSGTLTKGGVEVIPGASFLSDGETIVWTPPTNANGNLGAFTVRAWDGQSSSLTAVPVQIQVAAENDPPVASDITRDGNEDESIAVTIPATDVDSSSLTFAVVSEPANGTLSPGSTSVRVYHPHSDWNGIDSFSFRADDGENFSNVGTVTIVVDSVNDRPSFLANDPPAVGQNSGVQTISAWATFTHGPENESEQSIVEYTVSGISNPTLFTSAPTVAQNGALTYTVAPDNSGSSAFDVRVRDSGGTANGGVDTSVIQRFVITVNPGVTAIAQEITGHADSDLVVTLAGSGGASEQLTFTIADLPSNGDLFQYSNGSRGFAINSEGTTVTDTVGRVIFAPGSGTTGGPNAVFQFTANDGISDSAPAIVSINILAVVVDQNELAVGEGTTGTLQVRLNAQPLGDVALIAAVLILGFG